MVGVGICETKSRGRYYPIGMRGKYALEVRDGPTLTGSYATWLQSVYSRDSNSRYAEKKNGKRLERERERASERERERSKIGL